jgi:ubiquinone biosynthesis protein
MGDPSSPAAEPQPGEAQLSAGGFELLVEGKPPGLVRRYFTTLRHVAGILAGALGAAVDERPPGRRHGFVYRTQVVLRAGTRPFLGKRMRDLPFPEQLRRRLEILGPTYIKLGQILSLREDLLPRSITEELKNLLDKLPAVPYERFLELLEEEIGRPWDEVFSTVDETPLGSASIGQIHRATTIDGDVLILKMVKPGIREVLKRDVVLLRSLGFLLQIFLGRFQPRRVIREFCDYTVREVDLRLEADNAETFAANFKDEPDVVFPKIYRSYTTQNLIAMEFFDGIQPGEEARELLTEEERDRVVDVGAGAIIRMLYRDGFFHADLHPGNLIILPGPKAGFIDLGMVGRFDDELRRTLLYYYYCLVMGDAENAARYLTALAEPGPGSDKKGFTRAVEEISRRWHRAANFEDFSIGQLILESVGHGGQFRMYFPVEMVLMVKAIVTFEGVGHLLKPGFDVAGVSRRHVNRLFLRQFSPLRLAKEGLRGAPELVDALVKAPMLITEGLRVLEQTTRQPAENPFTGIRGTVLAGFCLVAGAILAASEGPVLLWIGLFALGLILALRRGT